MTISSLPAVAVAFLSWTAALSVGLASTPEGVVSTIAGVAQVPGIWNQELGRTLFSHPSGVAVGIDGTLYVSDLDNHAIRKVFVDGQVSTIAGYPGVFGAIDATGVSARFAGPAGLAVDSAGNLFIADMYNHSIRTMDPKGRVRTLAGKADFPDSTDGVGEHARFNLPSAVALDTNGCVFVADSGNHAVRKIAPSGEVSTLAGRAGNPGFANGPGANARFDSPTGIALDANGNLFVADTGNHLIRKISPDGFVSTLAGRLGERGYADGTATQARFNAPEGIAVGPSGNIYVTDSGNCMLRRISPDLLVSSFAGEPWEIGADDGTGSQARFFSPAGIAVDAQENLYVADRNNHTIRRVSFPPGILSGPMAQTFAAGGTLSLNVRADGSGPMTYQWRKNGVTIPNATLPTLSITGVTPAYSGSYSVEISNSVGNVLTENVAVLVRELRPVSMLSQPSPNTTIASTGSLSVKLDATYLATDPVTYELWTAGGTSARPVAGASGTVPLDGTVSISPALLGLSAGDYVLRFTRRYSETLFTSAETLPFRIGNSPMEMLSGSYEVLLADQAHALGEAGPVADSARYRGRLSVTLTKAGLLSGKLQYLTAAMRPGADANTRAYSLLTRSFVARMQATPGAPNNWECSFALKSGTPAEMGLVSFSANFDVALPALSVRVEEHFSTGNLISTPALVTGASGMGRSLNRLPTQYQSATGRYSLLATDSSKQRQTALFLFVPPSGRILWTSRWEGLAGAGSASPFLETPEGVSLCIFEARTTSSASLLQARFLSGHIQLTRDATARWRFQPGPKPEQTAGLEEQFSSTNKTGSDAPETSGVSALGLDAAHSEEWLMPTPMALRSLLPTGSPLRLTLTSPAVETLAAPTIYTWSVAMNAAGQIRPIGIPSAGGLPPTLQLSLDRTRGEWKGSYALPNGARYTLSGIALLPWSGAPQLMGGTGWVETGTFPSRRSGTWTLEPGP